MAKQTKKKVVKPTRVRTVMIGRQGLDTGAAAYAKLLLDPCAAPLAHPVYSGGEGGYLIRADAYVTLAAGAGQTAGAMLWTPGAMGTTNSELVNIQGADGSTVLTAVGSGLAPAKGFLTNTASNMRCVAACAKVYYTGAESTRSGMLWVGQASGSVLDISDTATVNTMTQLCQASTRVPANQVEVIWKPNDADQLFTDPTATTLANEKDRKASILICVAGTPTATGVTVALTAIYEWQPIRNQGIAIPSLSKSPSSNTLDQVVNYLISRGARFINGIMENTSGALAREVSNLFGTVPSMVRPRITGFG